MRVGNDVNSENLMYFHPVWFLCRFFGSRVGGGGKTPG
jgi:hypothetical protein